MANVDKHKVAEFNGPSYEHDSKTGISKFYLITPTGNGNSLEILTGLLNEMPEFSISVNYENGPGAEWQDQLMSFMSSDLMKMSAMIGSANGSFKNLLKMGKWTKKIYAGYKPSSIGLNFRIYTSDSLGQSPIETWIRALNNYATLNSDNEFNLNSAFENIGRGMGNMAMTGNEATKIALSSFVSTKSNDDSSSSSKTEELKNKSNKVAKQVQNFNKTIETAITNYLNRNKGHDYSYRISVGTDTDDAYSFWNGESTKALVKLRAHYLIQKSDIDISNGFVKDIGQWINMNTTEETLATANKEDIEFKVEKIFTDIKSSTSDEQVKTDIDNIKAEYNKLSDRNQVDNDILDDPKMKAIYNTINAVGNLADKVGNLIVGKYDKNRVFRRFNKENALGEKLWYLVLYPDAFFNKENPLIVYISDWEFKYSEESNLNGRPLYCDFKITCCLDQIYSRAQWYRVLAPGVRDRNSISSQISPFERLDPTNQEEEHKKQYEAQLAAEIAARRNRGAHR
jgi:hypothetical protein